jgi:hypothetical protein
LGVTRDHVGKKMLLKERLGQKSNKKERGNEEEEATERD